MSKTLWDKKKNEKAYYYKQLFSRKSSDLEAELEIAVFLSVTPKYLVPGFNLSLKRAYCIINHMSVCGYFSVFVCVCVCVCIYTGVGQNKRNTGNFKQIYFNMV